MILLTIRTRTRGALFTTQSHRLFEEFEDDLEEEGAEWALSHIRSTFHSSFKQPSGYYESNVEIHNTSSGLEVWDGGQAGPVYGPWLEGVGSRNNTTRFRGYHAFRKAAQALEVRIESMGDRLLYQNVIPYL
ncbi:MAG TPA: hypothetical protein VJQ57_13770 [Acidimicrobiia bacterium]|nr:hypothetical protein [Acidimicrobiia bacterium]